MRTERVLPWFIWIYQYITSAVWNVPIGRLRAGDFVRATFCGWWHTSLFEEIPQVVGIVYSCHYSSFVPVDTQVCWVPQLRPVISVFGMWMKEDQEFSHPWLHLVYLYTMNQPNKTYYSHSFNPKIKYGYFGDFHINVFYKYILYSK